MWDASLEKAKQPSFGICGIRGIWLQVPLSLKLAVHTQQDESTWLTNYPPCPTTTPP
jgi:hypothetical protein